MKNTMTHFECMLLTVLILSVTKVSYGNQSNKDNPAFWRYVPLNSLTIGDIFAEEDDQTQGETTSTEASSPSTKPSGGQWWQFLTTKQNELKKKRKQRPTHNPNNVEQETTTPQAYHSHSNMARPKPYNKLSVLLSKVKRKPYSPHTKLTTPRTTTPTTTTPVPTSPASTSEPTEYDGSAVFQNNGVLIRDQYHHQQLPSQVKVVQLEVKNSRPTYPGQVPSSAIYSVKTTRRTTANPSAKLPNWYLTVFPSIGDQRNKQQNEKPKTELQNDPPEHRTEEEDYANKISFPAFLQNIGNPSAPHTPPPGESTTSTSTTPKPTTTTTTMRTTTTVRPLPPMMSTPSTPTLDVQKIRETITSLILVNRRLLDTIQTQARAQGEALDVLIELRNQFVA